MKVIMMGFLHQYIMFKGKVYHFDSLKNNFKTWFQSLLINFLNRIVKVIIYNYRYLLIFL